MKKYYQIFASVALSVLAIGATAQNLNNVYVHAGKGVPVHRPASVKSNNQTARTESSSHYLLDYVNGDQINDASQAFYYWLPPMYSNVNYTLADTVYSPRTSANANTYTAQYSTVAFDTLWDLYTSSYYNPVITSTAQVDTIWASMAYRNTSNKNDTVDFEVVGVDANGFPTATVYGTDQVIFNQAGPLTYYTHLDSVQTIAIVPATPITIPLTARHKWNFAINFKVHGSKQDTVGLWYYSPGFNCVSFGICNAYTVMGVKDGRAPAVNSFVTGNMWFNDIKNGGNGAVEVWPNTGPSATAGKCAISSGAYYYDQLYAGCGTDSAYYYVQDLALYASVTFNGPLGMKELSTNGFELGQNYPNPFNKNTQIAYNLAKESDVVFTVYDMAGREIINNSYSTVAAGPHTINLAANQFTPGVYFYSINVNGVKVTKRMVITQ
jgi:hypothetical protein